MIARIAPFAVGFAISIALLQQAAPAMPVRHTPKPATFEDMVAILRSGGQNVEVRTVYPPLRVTQDKPDWPRVLQFAALEKQCDLPAGLLEATMRVESSGDPQAVNGDAVGLFQFTSDTARRYGINDRTDAAQSARGAAQLFCDLKKQYKGNTRKMIVAWNWGMGNYRLYGKNGLPVETQHHLVKVRRNLKQIAERG